MKVIDETLLDEFRRKTRCEWCKAAVPGCQPHHLYAKGMGGGSVLDVKVNLMGLCWKCHRDVHNGNIPRHALIAVVSYREGRSPDEIEKEIFRLLKEPKPCT